MIDNRIFTVLLLLISITASAQQAKTIDLNSKAIKHNWDANINFGSNLFYGDLRVYDYWPVKENNNERAWAYGFILRKHINPFFSVQGQLLYGKLAGSKRYFSDGVRANQYFNATMFEYNLSAHFNFLNLILGYDPSRRFSAYLLAGIGMVDFRSVKRYITNDKFINSVGYKNGGKTKKEMTTETMIPIGGGFSYKINDRFYANLNITLRGVNTDKLDATEGTSSDVKDMYGYTSIGVSYRFHMRKQVKYPILIDADSEERIVETDTIVDSIPNTPTMKLDLTADLPANAKPGDEIKAKLSINKEFLNGGKLVIKQVWPKGITPVAFTSSNPSYKIYNDTVVITWNNLPNAGKFNYSYDVRLSNDISEGSYPIAGSMHYNGNGLDTMYNFKNHLYVEQPITEAVATNVEQEQEQEQPVAEEKQTHAIKELEFRVQISASYGKPATLTRLKGKYNIEETIREDKASGWYVYSVGSFDSYHQAKALCNKLKSQNNAEGAFVVAFVNGTRLSHLRELKNYNYSIR